MYQNPYSNNISLGSSLTNLLLPSNNTNYLPPLNRGLSIGFKTNPIQQKHKVFISYQHKWDWPYKEEISGLIKDISIDKSVCDGDIDPDNKDAYIKRLINETNIKDSTVLIVLLGKETHYRKFIDWEISAALDYRVGNRKAGLIGIILPTHPSYNTGFIPFYEMPPRLWQNLESGYAQGYFGGPWIYGQNYMKNIIQTAFNSRKSEQLVVNSMPQFKRNKSVRNTVNFNKL